MTDGRSSIETSPERPHVRGAASHAANVWWVALVLVAMSLFARSAQAQLHICNKSNERVSMAVAYGAESQGTSRGWYAAEPAECITLVAGALGRRYYYVRGEGANGNTWAGEYLRCTVNDRFSYTGGADCTASGYARETFFRIDTGNETVWTHNLTLSSPTSGQSMHAGIADLGVSWRISVDQETWVMQLHNAKPFTVDVGLKCFTVDGAWKTLHISVLGKGMSEVGFMQGWPGNFVPGERCEAYHGDELVWRVNMRGSPTPA